MPFVLSLSKDVPQAMSPGARAGTSLSTNEAGPGSESIAFAYHRSVAPMIWVLVALSMVELCAVHLLVALLWSVTAAAILSVATLGGIAWLVRLIRSFRRLPVLLGPEGLTWRAGSLRSVTVPLAHVAGARTQWDAVAVKRRDVFNAALIAYPNVVLDLSRPVMLGRRQVRALAHRLDDPEALLAALARAPARQHMPDLDAAD